MSVNFAQVQEIIERNETAREIVMILLKHKHGLYSANIAKKLKISPIKVKNQIAVLNKFGLFDSKSIRTVFLRQGGKKGTFIDLNEEGIKVINTDGSVEIPTVSRYLWKTGNQKILVDKEGFQIPVREKKGVPNVRVYRIKSEFKKILSEML